MFKKSLMALALVGAAAAAQAGNVQVYGVVDAGVDYVKSNAKITSNLNNKDINIKINEHSTKLASGKHSANRFGIKGTEDIADNLKAGFVLEGGFDLLNGDMADKGKLFNRQADLFIEGDFGHLAFGRVGTLTSANGTYGFFGNAADNFAGGWGEHIGAAKNAFVASGRIDNAVTYVSPEVAGAKLYAQYSFNTEGAQQDKLHENERYAAIGASYKLNDLELVAVFDKTFYKDHVYNGVKLNNIPSKISDKWSLNLGGSYDFEVSKVFVAYQHADHSFDFGKGSTKLFMNTLIHDATMKGLFGEERVNSMIDRAQGLKSDTFAIGADTPLAGGLLKTQFAMGKAKNHSTYNGGSYIKNLNGKATTLSLAAAYEYNLSKQTMLYVGGGYSYDKYKVDMDFKNPSSDVLSKFFSGLSKVKNPDTKVVGADFKPTHNEVKYHNYEVMMGLVHKF